MKVVYLVDYIGIHCGMHYYLEAFKKVLLCIPEIEVKILSNYSDNSDEESFFYNQYKGSIFNKVYALLCNILKLKRFVKNNRDAIFIYLTYGNCIDVPFIKIVTSVSNHLIDIHEAIAQDKDSDVNLKRYFKSLYKNRVKGVISHSARTNNYLNEYKFSGIKFEVPHFKYVFHKEYERALIHPEILNAPDKSRINLMFFGNITENKGIDILLESINRLSSDIARSVNIIIAGKDFDGSIDKVKIRNDRNIKIFKRHISDGELRFLYQNADYILLPYRKTSQSGILEMAFYFQKPIIASDIPYFRKMLSLFPSFGFIAGNSSTSFADTITTIVLERNNIHHFAKEDYDRYSNRKEVTIFINKIAEWLNIINN